METPNPLDIVIDDDASVRGSLARLLRSAGIGYQGFASAESFIDSVLLDSAACLIIDVQMPGMGGLELQAFCKERRPVLPIVMMSAFSDDDVETGALAEGAVAFFHKPFDADALVKLLQRVIYSPATPAS